MAYPYKGTKGFNPERFEAKLKAMHYETGQLPPNYPVPAKLTRQSSGHYVSYATWFTNPDGFWSGQGGARGISR